VFAEIMVIKRDGRKEALNISKIRKYTLAACKGLDGVDYSELELDAKLQFRDGITTEEIQQTLIKTAVDKIDVDRPNWNFVAARLFLYDLYHRVTGFTGYNHLREYFEKGEKAGRILPGLKEKYNLDDLNEYIKPERDLQFTYLGIKTLYDRYIIKDKEGKPIELPQQLFMGVAMFLAQNETNPESIPEEDRDEINLDDVKEIRGYWAKKFYDVMSKFEIMMATPTLSNARTTRHQLSSCYLGSCSDNIEGIFDDYKEMALLSKFGGGIGWDFSKIRALGSFIDNHKNAAGGVIPWLKITNDIAIAVDQLGCVARGTYVRVLKSVTTDKYKHDFRREYSEPLVSPREEMMGVASYASKFAFEYGDFSKNFVSSLIYDYVMGTPRKVLQDVYKLSKDQYKKIIGKYKKIDKGLPDGFEPIIGFEDYLINKNGVVIDRKKLKRVSRRINRKGYITVSLGKKSVPIHLLLAKQFIPEYSSDLTVDHIDGNKLNNSLENLQIITNEENISKGWERTRDKRIEMGRIKKHLTMGYKLKGDRRGTDNINIKEIEIISIPIEKVRVGDIIESYNIEKERVELKPVIGTFNVEVKKEAQKELIFSDGNNLVTSEWHPFPVFKNGKLEYVRTDEVNIGDKTINNNGEVVEVVEIRDGNKDIEFCDLTVKDNNNYFCSTDSKNGNYHLIHNTRKGAIAVYLEPWHMDILDFLDLKKNSGEERRRAHDLFPALWIPDLFMKRVEKDEMWTLFDPYDVGDLTDCYGEEFERKYIEYENREDIPKRRIKAKELWKKILLEYYETGNPFLCFKDNANRRNQNDHSGIIRSSNLCSEIFQNTEPNHYKVKVTFEDESFEMFEEDDNVEVESGEVKVVKKAKKITSLDSISGKQVYIVEKVAVGGKTAVCNLASVNLSKVNTSKKIAEVVPIAIRMLDNVIDLNFYPVRKTKDTNLKNRAIGLGAMGEAQMLAEKQIHWGSDEHLRLIDEIFENISYHAINASCDLAREKGVYPEFESSRWAKGILPIDTANEEAKKLVQREYVCNWDKLREKVKKGIRNGYLMAIAPTSSISILTGTTQTIEPVYKRKWYEENLSGLIPVVVPNLSTDTYMYYTPAYELDQRILVKAAAIRQKWIDQGQSLNIFITTDKASGRYLNEIYMLGWKLGLKSFYYLRSQSPEVKEDVMDRSVECFGCQ